MEGKIDKHGRLCIVRGDQLTYQLCPFAGHLQSQVPDDIRENAAPWCGDWCPLFGEPLTSKINIATTGGESEEVYGQTTLDICNNKMFRFDEFTDEREG